MGLGIECICIKPVRHVESLCHLYSLTPVRWFYCPFIYTAIYLDHLIASLWTQRWRKGLLDPSRGII